MKKVLIIVYYWPPSGGAGVQRWLKFVKFLPQFGWQPTVITTKNGDYPVLDESLEKEVPGNIQVIRTKTPTFRKLFSTVESIPYGSLESKSGDSFSRKTALWFRRHLIIPDARKVWNRYALSAASKELKSNDYDAVITSGPPHSTHLVGLKIREKSGVKWLADFRDPWTKIDYLEKVKRHPLTEKWDRKLETRVVHGCDMILSINQKILNDLEAQNKGVIIPNGFDPADFKIPGKKETTDFQINYFGNITAERNPLIVLKAVNRIFSDAPEIRLNFWGNVSAEIKEQLAGLDKNNILSIHNYIPHDQMLEKMLNSSLLLLLINNVPDNTGILTGKLYEYLGAKIPILGIGPVEGEAAFILQTTKTGRMFDYDQQKEIAEFILDQYKHEHDNNFDTDEINKFSRQQQTRQLAEILSLLTNLEKVYEEDSPFKKS